MLDILIYNPRVELLPDGRCIELLGTYFFKDSKGHIWVVEKGTIVDGASIPKFLWSVYGSPLVGKYRNGSILHDPACVSRDMPHTEVHNMFWEMMIACKVNKHKAYKMWFAVAHLGGPQWNKDGLDLDKTPEALAFEDEDAELY